MKRRLEEMQIGDSLCDMHDGLFTAQLKNDEIKTYLIRFEAEGGGDFIDKQIPVMYTNKILVLVGLPRILDGVVMAVFAYSYDDRSFGVVEVKAKPCPE